MDVEFQEVEEGVGHEVDSAIDLLLHAEEELQGPPRFVARREGDVLQLPVRVGDVLASLAGRVLAVHLWMGEGDGNLHCAVKAGDGDWLAGVVAASFLERLQWLLTACCAGEGGV